MKEWPSDLPVAHGLSDPSASHWHFRLGPIMVRLPNFAWRRAAIDAHDLHHLVTGYSFTLGGEIQLAAWEWGAGRYPDWRATAFCAPLIVAGALVMPRRTWRAFCEGRKRQSFYLSTTAESNHLVTRHHDALTLARPQAIAPASSGE